MLSNKESAGTFFQAISLDIFFICFGTMSEKYLFVLYDIL